MKFFLDFEKISEFEAFPKTGGAAVLGKRP
jgi:hypothetical protein